jgi:hypothetical protein
MEPIQDDRPYEPFDQAAQLGPAPWSDTPSLEAWEFAHGHDVRLKCYVEFGCQVIEPTLERRIAILEAERDRLIQALEQIANFSASYRSREDYANIVRDFAREALTKTTEVP